MAGIMNKTLVELRAEADRLCKMLPEEDQYRFDAYLEQFWNDKASLIEACFDMQAEIIENRRS